MLQDIRHADHRTFLIKYKFGDIQSERFDAKLIHDVDIVGAQIQANRRKAKLLDSE